MKYLLMFFVFFSLQAKIVETENSISYQLDSEIEAKKLYSLLSFPIDFGTKVTGKSHSYKAFEDKEKNFLIYCTEINKTNHNCLVSVNKQVKGENIELEDTDLQLHIMLTDYELGKKMFDGINTEPFYHGSYAIKVLSNENNDFGISCLTNTASYSDYQCDVRVFKKELVLK